MTPQTAARRGIALSGNDKKGCQAGRRAHGRLDAVGGLGAMDGVGLPVADCTTTLTQSGCLSLRVCKLLRAAGGYAGAYSSGRATCSSSTLPRT